MLKRSSASSFAAVGALSGAAGGGAHDRSRWARRAATTWATTTSPTRSSSAIAGAWWAATYGDVPQRRQLSATACACSAAASRSIRRTATATTSTRSCSTPSASATTRTSPPCLRVQKNGLYRYDMTWRLNDYYNPGLTVAGGLHLHGHRAPPAGSRRDCCFRSRNFRVRAGYSRNMQDGPALSTAQEFDTNGAGLAGLHGRAAAVERIPPGRRRGFRGLQIHR